LRTRILSIGAFVLLSVFVFAVSPGAARETVRFKGYSAGTIVIKTNERRLYYVTGDGEAIRYPVGVGKAGQAWAGTTAIDGKYISPAWQAPESIRKDYAKLPPIVPGGSPSNPMGAAAMTLSGAANMPSMAPTVRDRSAGSSRTDAFACTIRTLWICTHVSVWARPSLSCGDPARPT
jgi:L,D-transpeptidase catalytic domain